MAHFRHPSNPFKGFAPTLAKCVRDKCIAEVKVALRAADRVLHPRALLYATKEAMATLVTSLPASTQRSQLEVIGHNGITLTTARKIRRGGHRIEVGQSKTSKNTTLGGPQVHHMSSGAPVLRNPTEPSHLECAYRRMQHRVSYAHSLPPSLTAANSLRPRRSCAERDVTAISTRSSMKSAYSKGPRRTNMPKLHDFETNFKE